MEKIYTMKGLLDAAINKAGSRRKLTHLVPIGRMTIWRIENGHTIRCWVSVREKLERYVNEK